MDPTYDLAKNVVQTSYDALPTVAVEAAKLQILDTIGVAIAGSNEAGVPELLGILKGLGGRKESSVIAYSTKLPAPHAAQVNATMSHALDYDDDHHDSNTHPGCIVVPTALAMAEAIGKVSGKECIAAIALGGDLLVRIGGATWYEGGVHRSGWHATTINGVFGATAVAGKMLGLDEDKMVNALGIAYHQAAGNLQCTLDGALTKRIGPGFVTRDGIMSALMAKAGITGAHNCFEGKRSLYNIYHQGGYKRDYLLQDLGKRFLGAELVFKPYPCVRQSHVSIEAALGLVTEHNIKPEEVEGITVFGGKTGYHLCTPLEVRCKPRTVVDAQFSIPWVVSTAIVKREVGIADFTEEAIKNKDVLRVAEKIRVEESPELLSSDGEPIRIKIVTKRGTFTKQVDHAKGDSENPMRAEDIVKKFRDCASYSTKSLSKKTVDSIIESIANIEKLGNVGDVIRLIR